jgi:flagellin
MQVRNTGDRSVFPIPAENALKRTSKELQKILAQISTGLRINNASDDAAGLAISEQLRSNIRGFKTASQNITDAMSALNVADGATKSVTEILGRQRELALSARNDTLTAKDRGTIDTEYQALSKELDRLANSTQFNKQSLTNGTDLGSGNAVIQTGAEAGDQMNLPQINIQAITLGIQGTSVATSTGAGNALDLINNAMENVLGQRSTLGATVNQLESSINNLSVAMVNTQAAESVIRDEDMARGLSELVKIKILQEGSTNAFARFNEISKNHAMGLLGQM